MADYIKKCLRPLLQGDVSDDIVEYISTIKHIEDYEEFMENLVDINNEEHMRSYEALKQHQFGHPRKVHNKNNKQDGQGSSSRNDRGSSSRNSQTNLTKQNEPTQSSNPKGKKRFTNFYSHNQKPGLMKGRHPCNCQATLHELINNCTKCGRIVCAQEGSGPCFFCDDMVCTREEMEVLNQNTRESDKLYNHLIEQKKSKEWKKAIETRNRLIKTDQMGDLIKKVVYDDQDDYFDLNSKWLSEEEKGNLKKRHASIYSRMHRQKKDIKLALDFASRTVICDDDDFIKNKSKIRQSVDKLLDSKETRFPKNIFDGDKGDLVAEIVKLMEEQSAVTTKTEVNKQESNRKVTNEIKKPLRVANADLLESIDQGLCMSMHQPHASLLVAGIKIHEGRTWRTEHRGRLWIAAAAKEPDSDEILACEEMYRVIYNDNTLEFPKKYPTGCLLGCVFVEDCLNQEEYRRRFPNGESSSPYVFICSNPVILPIFYPLSGQHKIYQLPKEIHRIAKGALMSSKWV